MRLLVNADHEVEICLSIKPAQNVIQLYGISTDAPDDRPRLVMELCPHGNLRDHVNSLPMSSVSKWRGAGVCQELAGGTVVLRVLAWSFGN